MAKRLFIKTYGCQMNVYDSDRMTRLLAPLGYRPVETPDEADMVVLNTCHIREKASEKVFSELGRLRLVKEERQRTGDDLLVAVAGCVAQAEGEEIARRAPHVDIVVGPQSYHRLPELIARTSRAAGRDVALETDFDVEAKFDGLADDATQAQGPAAFLTVQEGCDKFCTFCVVPYTRGAEYSRPAADILRDASALVANGTVEITLLGQNVNAWHGAGPDGSDWTLGRLVRALAEIDGLARIRYTTSHPLEMTADLISAHGEVPQLMPYLHLPVQSGSDRILRAMNRRHDRETYFRIVDRLREARPDIALSSDFIVGFPGESDADFALTMDLVSRCGFAQAYSFKYSPRPGTPASASTVQVDEPVKSARLAELQTAILAGQSAFNAASAGRTLPVLLEREGRHPGQLVGRSPYMQAVHVDAPLDLMGRIVNVVVERGLPNSLAGRLAGDAATGVAA